MGRVDRERSCLSVAPSEEALPHYSLAPLHAEEHSLFGRLVSQPHPELLLFPFRLVSQGELTTCIARQGLFDDAKLKEVVGVCVERSNLINIHEFTG